MLLLATSLSFLIVHFWAVTGESLYTVIRNIQEISVQDLHPYASQEAQVDTVCTTLCSLDINCISVIHDGNDLKCHMFTVSQDSVIAISDDETGFSYAEKVDCTWTSLNHDDCCYPGTLSCLPQSSINGGSGIFEDCQDAFDHGARESGAVYYLKPRPNWRVIKAVCEFDSTSGWTVIQRRLDGSVDFYRYWSDYRNGFGDTAGEYWIGLRNMYHLTRANRKLSIFLEAHDGLTMTANYSSFSVQGADQDYRLKVSGYSGDECDSFVQHDNEKFSAQDKDNDNTYDLNCAITYKGGWWYDRCYSSNLNGVYYEGGTSASKNAASWYCWKGHEYSYKTIILRIGR